jgi:hypothetical protein
VLTLQGYTKDVDTALVTTSEVTDYPMILLLGIGYVSDKLQLNATACHAHLQTFRVLSRMWHLNSCWIWLSNTWFTLLPWEALLDSLRYSCWSMAIGGCEYSWFFQQPLAA